MVYHSPLKNSYVYYIPMTSTDKTKGPIVKVDLHCEDINVEFLHLTETLMEYFLEESAALKSLVSILHTNFAMSLFN